MTKKNDHSAALTEGDAAGQAVPADQLSHAAPTKGPWVVGRDGQKWNSPSSPYVAIEAHRPCEFGGEPTRYHLAEVSYPTTQAGTVGELERRANAHLIAAAPELLDVVRELAAGFNGGEIDAADWPLMNKAMAALAKAEGR